MPKSSTLDLRFSATRTYRTETTSLRDQWNSTTPTEHRLHLGKRSIPQKAISAGCEGVTIWLTKPMAYLYAIRIYAYYLLTNCI